MPIFVINRFSLRRAVSAVLVLVLAASGLAACTNDDPEIAGPAGQAGFEAAVGQLDTNSSNIITSGPRLTPISTPDDSQGAEAPVFSALDQDGQRTTLGGDDTGRVITFLSHWCATCDDDLTALSEWHQDATLPEGVEPVVVSTAADSSRTNYPPSAWLDGWDGGTAMDDHAGTLAAAFGVSEVPATVAIKADGTILYRSTGVLDAAKLDELAASVAPGSTETPDFAAATGPLRERGPVEVEGEVLTTLSTPDASVGSKAPTLKGIDPTEQPVSYTAGDGTGRLILFVAHWCPYCNQELPIVTDYLANNELPEGVEIVTVSTGQDETRDHWPPSQWFAENNWTPTVLIDDEAQTAAAAYGLPAFPFWAAVSPDGELIYRQSGGLGAEQITELANAVAPGSTTTELSFVNNGIKRVPPTEAEQIVTNPPEGLKVLDLRQPEEIAATGTIAGAENIDFYQEGFADVIAGLDKTVPYLIYCETGNRSAATIEFMSQQGFGEVYDLEGGIQAWIADGLPVTPS